MDRFDRRVVVLDPGATRAHDDAEWADAIVLVGAGTVEARMGGDESRVRFGPGDVLTFDGLALREMHNPGPDRAVLVRVARRLRAVR